jgi:hypothetical protein
MICDDVFANALTRLRDDPTVPRGTERLRIMPTPFMAKALINQLIDALVDVWLRLELPFARSLLAAEQPALG